MAFTDSRALPGKSMALEDDMRNFWIWELKGEDKRRGKRKRLPMSTLTLLLPFSRHTSENVSSDGRVLSILFSLSLSF